MPACRNAGQARHHPWLHQNVGCDLLGSAVKLRIGSGRVFWSVSARESRKGKRRTAKNAGKSTAKVASCVSCRKPVVSSAAGAWFEKLVALQARLPAAPGGCPWDAEQTHQSLRTFLIEEAYETLDALESGTPQVRGRTGRSAAASDFPLLLAQEAGQFTIADVIESVYSKMVRRHPHVFGTVKAGTSGGGAEELGTDQGGRAPVGKEP